MILGTWSLIIFSDQSSVLLLWAFFEKGRRKGKSLQGKKSVKKALIDGGPSFEAVSLVEFLSSEFSHLIVNHHN